MTLVSSSAVKCLVGWGSKAIRWGLLTFDVKEKLSFEMSQLLIRQQGVNVFSYASVRISDITVLFASCDAFLYPFLLFIFGSFFFLLHLSVCCAIIILHVFSSSLFLSFLLSFIFFVLSSKQLTHRNLTKLPRIFQMWFSSWALFFSDHILYDVGWVNNYEVSVIWTNRVQNLGMLQICNVGIADCHTVSLHIYICVCVCVFVCACTYTHMASHVTWHLLPYHPFVHWKFMGYMHTIRYQGDLIINLELNCLLFYKRFVNLFCGEPRKT